MSQDTVDYYIALAGQDGWLGGEALCVTWARGVDEDRMIRAFGGNPAEAREMTPGQSAGELSGYHYSSVPDTVLVTRRGDWVIGIEYNGFQGSRPEVLRPLSGSGPALSVYWNVNATNEFAYAIGGRKAVSFDMYFPDPERRYGTDPHLLDEHIDRLPFGVDHNPKVAGLALAEHLTGVRLTKELMESPFRRAVITPVP